MKNKKWIALALGAAMALSLAACGGNQPAKGNMPADAGNSAASSDSIQIPNPWVQFETLEEAAQAVGFELTVSDAIDGYNDKTIQALTDGSEKIIEVRYENQTGDQVCIRKAPGRDDISGVYTDYSEERTVSAGEAEVTLKGNDGTVFLATWCAGGYTFSIYTDGGCTVDDMTALAAQVG